MKKIALLTIILTALSVPTAYAFDFIRGNSGSLGGCSVISEGNASELLSVPSLSLDDRQGKVELGINRMHNMKEFDRVYLASAYRLSKFTFGLGFSQQGKSDLYTEKIGRLSAAFHIDSVTIGLNLSLMSVGFNDHYESLSGTALGIGSSYRYRFFALALTIDNINNPRLDDFSTKIKPSLNFYSEYFGLKSYSIVSRITVQENEKPQFGVGQRIRVSNIAALHWGVSTAPTTYGGGLELIYKVTKISYNASYHPELGLSQNIFFEYTY